MKLHPIDTGYFKLDGGAMFGVVPKSIWNKLNPADDNNMCNWALRCLLIEDGNKLVLIDTGIGNKQDDKFFSHYYLHGDNTLTSSLAKLGFTPSDITDVVQTHLHFDHCGGSVERKDGKLVTAFPNATYWSNEAHWDWAVHPNDREKASFLKENILPIRESGQLKMVSVPDTGSQLQPSTAPLPEQPSEILPGLSFRFVNGHTRAMMLPQIRYKDRTIVYMADLLPSVAHIPLPYVMAYDMFPLVSLGEKKSFLPEAAENQYILFFEHDPTTECCTVQEIDGRIKVAKTGKLEELV